MVTGINLNRVVKYGVPAVTIGVPAAYMIHFHDQFYTKRENRIKMFNKQLGFWGGLSAGLYVIHKNLRKFKTNKILFAASAAFMAIAPYLGVQAGKLVNQLLFPIDLDDMEEYHHHHQGRYANKDFDVFLKSTQNT